MTESPFMNRPLVMNTPQQGARLSSPPRVSPPNPSKFKNGDLVEVAARTWPGINKQGGMGRITRVHYTDGTKVLYDVSYILGGSERRVEEKFIRVGSLETGHRVPKERDFFFNYTQEKPKTPAPTSSKKSSLSSSSARRSESGSAKRATRSSSSHQDSETRAERRWKRHREAYHRLKMEDEQEADSDDNNSSSDSSSSTSSSDASNDEGPVSRRSRIIGKGTVLKFDKASDEENESMNGDSSSSSSSSSESENSDSDNDSEPIKEVIVKSVPSRSATPASSHQPQKENTSSQSVATTTTPIVSEREKPKLDRAVSSSSSVPSQRKGGRKALKNRRLLRTNLASAAGEASGASELIRPLPLNRSVSASSVQTKPFSSESIEPKQSVEVVSPPPTPLSYPVQYHDPYQAMQTNASWKPFVNMPTAPIPSSAVNTLLNEQAEARHHIAVGFRLEADRLFLLFQLEMKKATDEMWFRPLWSQMAKHPLVTASEIHRGLIVKFEKMRDDMIRRQQMQAKALYSMQMLAFANRFSSAPNAAQVPMVVPLFPYSFI